ncbi:hypothetical protein [Actinoplanes rectilineatus]|uniref:hypothetical protein n=1 Tax=Actinoplanes rectilineatus TaxID=113571 RepID=UPI0005F2A131|nr:hypothetical protein [Actinoplanes rectilineatus]
MIDAHLWDSPLPHPSPLLLLILAATCLVVAIRFMKRAVEPLGAIVESMAAAIAVFLTLGLALVLVVTAALSA